MSWIVEYLPEAKNDLQKLDHAAQVQVLKGIDKVAQNPLPRKAAVMHSGIAKKRS